MREPEIPEEHYRPLMDARNLLELSRQTVH
jgi:hypothetical protein